MVKSSDARRRVGEVAETLTDDERRTRALEDIADSLRGMRSAFIDISIWIAHIGRNVPTARKN